VQGKGYLFTSDRLGFRNWIEDDVKEMIAINSNAEVMAYFPSIQDEQQTIAFVQRMQNQFHEKGYCYYAVDRLDSNSFIGFIGLSRQAYQAAFTPCVDIGWRLKKAEWNQGFATEGARRCLAYAFNDLNIETVYAVAPKVNLKSEHIMQAIGMEKLGEFVHPLLLDDIRLKRCVVYRSQNIL
jgi:RimJ/RimL family protein N-acetyltransferase